MSTSTSIPKSPTPGKDPPSHTPTPEPNKPTRPSPLRNPTSESLHPPPPPAAAAADDKDPPAFAPLFTLIHDPSTNTTHHPHKIHYLFADDDTHALTSACLRALPNGSSSTPDAAPQERVLIVDLAADGGIKSAHSLSAEWQVVSAAIDKAPTWEGSAEEGGAGGLMLRVEGVGVEREQEGERDRGLGLMEGEEEMRGLVEEFERKMGVLRRIAEAGGGLVGGDEDEEEDGEKEEKGEGPGGEGP